MILGQFAYSDVPNKYRFLIIRSWKVVSAATFRLNSAMPRHSFYKTTSIPNQCIPSDKVHNHTFQKQIVTSVSRMRAACL